MHFEKGDYESAIADCDKAVERGRELRADYALIARALARKGNALVKQVGVVYRLFVCVCVVLGREQQSFGTQSTLLVQAHPLCKRFTGWGHMLLLCVCSICLLQRPRFDFST